MHQNVARPDERWDSGTAFQAAHRGGALADVRDTNGIQLLEASGLPRIEKKRVPNYTQPQIIGDRYYSRYCSGDHCQCCWKAAKSGIERDVGI